MALAVLFLTPGKKRSLPPLIVADNEVEVSRVMGALA
jgi:hypothetical protein